MKRIVLDDHVVTRKVARAAFMARIAVRTGAANTIALAPIVHVKGMPPRVAGHQIAACCIGAPGSPGAGNRMAIFPELIFFDQRVRIAPHHHTVAQVIPAIVVELIIVYVRICRFSDIHGGVGKLRKLAFCDNRAGMQNLDPATNLVNGSGAGGRANQAPALQPNVGSAC